MSCHRLVYCVVRDFQRDEVPQQMCLIFDSTTVEASNVYFIPILSASLKYPPM